jgi:hypothetical protein
MIVFSLPAVGPPARRLLRAPAGDGNQLLRAPAGDGNQFQAASPGARSSGAWGRSGDSSIVLASARARLKSAVWIALASSS